MTDRPAVRVAASATDGAKTVALRGTRYGASATEELRALAVQRAAALAPEAAAGEARLVWAPVGGELEARWLVRVAVTMLTGPQTYLAAFTTDGALAALDREEGR